MKQSKIIVAGIGPGSEQDITPAVLAAVREADVVVGYKYYFRFIRDFVRPDAECIDTGMKRERARAEQAFEYAEQGKTVCVISSGDAGIYGMTPLIYEMKRERQSNVEIIALPGISAFQKAASLLGAPIGKKLSSICSKFADAEDGVYQSEIRFGKTYRSEPRRTAAFCGWYAGYWQSLQRCPVQFPDAGTVRTWNSRLHPDRS